jgi:hypothetical protein
MKSKVVPILGWTMACALSVAGWILFHGPEKQPAPVPIAAAHAPAPKSPIGSSADLPEIQPSSPSSPPAAAVPPDSKPPDIPASSPVAPPGKTSASASQPQRPPKPAKKPKPPLQDPVARAAMIFVGADPDAEAYWLDAIFDSSLPEKEREDLMEDLNEEGLSDHKHPGPEDLPLIINRLALIEQIAPDADEFMLPHLWEAYKDLANLAYVTQGEGVPVR